MKREVRRRTPEELLREVQAEEGGHCKGHLKIFLGYASGVGKSFRMLDEARRRRERGPGRRRRRGSAEGPAGGRSVAAQAGGHSPQDLRRRHRNRRGSADPRGTPRSASSTAWPTTIRPASRNPTRWQDVQDLVNAGIKVIGSINIQYIDGAARAGGGDHRQAREPDGADLVHQERRRNRDRGRSARRAARAFAGGAGGRREAGAAAIQTAGTGTGARRGCRRSPAQRLPGAPRNQAAFRHAGTHSRVHDSARQHAGDAGSAPDHRGDDFTRRLSSPT